MNQVVVPLKRNVTSLNLVVAVVVVEVVVVLVIVVHSQELRHENVTIVLERSLEIKKSSNPANRRVLE